MGDTRTSTILLHLPAYRDPELIPTIEDALANQKVKCIYESRDSTLWLGTRGDGIRCFKNGIWYNLSTYEGLPHPDINAICEADDDTMWLGSDCQKKKPGNKICADSNSGQ